jgi:hypothetical protein
MRRALGLLLLVSGVALGQGVPSGWDVLNNGWSEIQTPAGGAALSGGVVNRFTLWASASTVTTGLLLQGTNIVSQTNLANAQTFRLYNTTDSDTAPVNSEYVALSWNTNIASLLVNLTGTGTARKLQVGTNTNTGFEVVTNGAIRFSVLSNGQTQSGNGGNSYDWGSAGTEWRSLYAKTSLQGANVKTLTESSNTNFATVAVTSSTACGGEIYYTVLAADATNTQAVKGVLNFAAVANSSGTVTSTSGELGALNPVSSGTLTNTFTLTNGSQLLTFGSNAVSSLTQTTLNISFRVHIASGTCTVTAL